MTLTCEDNGLGMNQDLIERYFMRIGHSYYQSMDFRDQALGYSPTSFFGLGFMSCFMLADRVKVETRHFRTDLSGLDQALTIDVDGPNRYFVIRPGERVEPGTSITLFIRPDAWSKYSTVTFDVGWYATHPRFPIRAVDLGKIEIAKDKPFTLSKPSRMWGLHRAERMEVVSEHMAAFDFRLKAEETGGLRGAIRLLFLRGDKGELVWRKEEGNVVFRVGTGDPEWGHGDIEYRKWKIVDGKRKGVQERGVFSAQARGQVWSQDGFRVGGAFPVPTRSIPMPIPCVLDVDLAGDWKLTLDVTRSTYAPDNELEKFKRRFYPLVADLLRQVLRKQKMLPVTEKSRAFIDQLFIRSDPLLRLALAEAIDYSPK